MCCVPACTVYAKLRMPEGAFRLNNIKHCPVPKQRHTHKMGGRKIVQKSLQFKVNSQLSFAAQAIASGARNMAGKSRPHAVVANDDAGVRRQSCESSFGINHILLERLPSCLWPRCVCMCVCLFVNPATTSCKEKGLENRLIPILRRRTTRG